MSQLSVTWAAVRKIPSESLLSETSSISHASIRADLQLWPLCKTWSREYTLYIYLHLCVCVRVRVCRAAEPRPRVDEGGRPVTVGRFRHLVRRRTSVGGKVCKNWVIIKNLSLHTIKLKWNKYNKWVYNITAETWGKKNGSCFKYKLFYRRIKKN